MTHGGNHIAHPVVRSATTPQRFEPPWFPLRRPCYATADRVWRDVCVLSCSTLAFALNGRTTGSGKTCSLVRSDVRDPIMANFLPAFIEISKRVVGQIDRAVPKDGRRWVFAVGANKSWGGNLQALYEAAVKDPRLDVTVVCVTPETSSLPPELGAVPTKSPEGLWALLRAGVIVVQYHCHDFYWSRLSSSARVLCNVWHGVHLKGLGKTDASASPKSVAYVVNDARRYGLICATSAAHRRTLAESFGIPEARLAITGLPRNDWLLAADEQLPASLNAQRQRLHDELGGRKLVLYAPTFRGASDGVYGFDDADVEALGEVLGRHGAVLGVRGHLNRAPGQRALPSEWFLDLGVSKYPEAQVLLRESRVMVTDYSGIWVDYLLLDRPAIAFCYDWDEYMSTRGLVYDYEAVFPGDIVKNVPALIGALERSLQAPDLGQTKRSAALDLFHDCRDAGASKRVMQRLYDITGL
jgi:CDP-glycerol glycerophosphotransferase (TagB/SpsB family)